MITTIDGGGRIVIPKGVRDELGLTPGCEVDISFDGLSIRVDRVPVPEPAVLEVDGLLVVSALGDGSLTDDDVRGLRDALHR